MTDDFEAALRATGWRVEIHDGAASLVHIYRGVPPCAHSRARVARPTNGSCCGTSSRLEYQSTGRGAPATEGKTMNEQQAIELGKAAGAEAADQGFDADYLSNLLETMPADAWQLVPAAKAAFFSAAGLTEAEYDAAMPLYYGR